MGEADILFGGTPLKRLVPAMSEFDPNFRRQIERTLGRPLIPEELATADSLASLPKPVLRVAKDLRSQQLVLCAVYLHAAVPTRGIELADFIDKLSEQ